MTDAASRQAVMSGAATGFGRGVVAGLIFPNSLTAAVGIGASAGLPSIFPPSFSGLTTLNAWQAGGGAAGGFGGGLVGAMIRGSL